MTRCRFGESEYVVIPDCFGKALWPQLYTGSLEIFQIVSVGE